MSEVSLNISNEVIKSIVESKIKSEVVSALAGSSDLIIEKLVDNIIKTKVDRNGKPTNSSYDQVGNMLDYVIQTELQKIVIESVKEWGMKSKDTIAKKIDDTLKKNGRKFASKLTESVVYQMSKEFSFKFFFEGSQSNRDIYDRMRDVENKLKTPQ